MALPETASRVGDGTSGPRLHTHRQADLQRLRTQITQMQRRSAQVDAIPVHSALAPLFPDGGLRPGSAYSLDASTSLLLALMAEPSRAGSWCAVIGVPELGAEAAEGYGVDLGRFALVPDPGERWLAVASAVAEVFPVVAVRPPHSAREADTARVGAKLRDRGGVLLVQGPWPQAESTLTVSDPEWTGLGHGHGLLSTREVTVAAIGRRIPVPRTVRVQLPGPLGAPMPVVEAARPGWRAGARLQAVAG